MDCSWGLRPRLYADTRFAGYPAQSSRVIRLSSRVIRLSQSNGGTLRASLKLIVRESADQRSVFVSSLLPTRFEFPDRDRRLRSGSACRTGLNRPASGPGIDREWG